MAFSLAEARSMSKEELLAKYERVKNGVRAAKVHTERIAEVMTDTALAAVGGAVSGFLIFKHPKVMADPKKPNSGYDTDAVAALVATGAVLGGFAKGHERQLLAIGQGLAGAVASREFLIFLQNRDAAAKAKAA
jgi:hypothetical protein